MTHRWEHGIVSEIRFIGDIADAVYVVPAGPVLCSAIVNGHHKLGFLPGVHWYAGIRLWWDVLGADLTHL